MAAEKPQEAIVTSPRNTTAQFALLIALAASVASGAALIQHYRFEHHFQQQHSEVTQDLQQLHNDMRVQTEAVTASATTLSDLKNTLGNNRKMWALIDAEHQMHLAKLQLEYQQNPKTALALLTYADEQLKSLNDPKLVSVRKDIAEHIANLRAIPEIDLTGLLSEFSALRTQIAKLPLLSVEIPKEKSVTIAETQTSDTKAWWRGALNTITDQLKNIVTVRRLDAPIKPLLSDASNAVLSQTIEYLILQAQSAALSGNQAVYHSNLQELTTLIKVHYQNNTAVLATLDLMSKRVVSQKMPELSDLITKIQSAQQDGKNA